MPPALTQFLHSKTTTCTTAVRAGHCMRDCVRHRDQRQKVQSACVGLYLLLLCWDESQHEDIPLSAVVALKDGLRMSQF